MTKEEFIGKIFGQYDETAAKLLVSRAWDAATEEVKKDHFKTATEFYGPLLTDCIEALEIGLNYVQESGWTRSRDKEAAIIQAAIDKAKEVLG